MAEWRETVAAVLGVPGIVMFLGAVDVGKTTAATALAIAAVRAGRPPGVVDTDIGQSDIGPPTTVGLGMVDRPVRQMLQIPLTAAYFTGDTTPMTVFPWLLEGTARLVARAQELGAAIVILDTTGWIDGPAAVAAKLRKIRQIGPRHLIAIQRADEVEPILSQVPASTMIHRLHPSPEARRRSPRERRAFREQQFARYFRNARPATVTLEAVRTERAVVHAGRRVAPGRVAAELPPRALRHRLVGLADDAGDFLGLGTIVAVRAAVGEIDVVAPLGAVGRTTVLQWGAMQVAPDGREERRAAGAA